MSEWISVDDRLPEEWIKCLLYTSEGIQLIAFLGPDKIFNLKYVTHWQPLPEPPS